MQTQMTNQGYLFVAMGHKHIFVSIVKAPSTMHFWYVPPVIFASNTTEVS